MNKSLAKFQRKAAKQEPEDEIEKIRLSFFQQDAPLLAHDQRITLSRTQLEKRDFYTKVWGMLLTKPDSEVEELIMQLKGCKRGMAMYIINQSQKLFGSIKTINREAQRAIRIAQREAEIRLIENDQILDPKDRYHLIHLNRERIEKMMKLDKDDEPTFGEIIDKLKMPDVVRTSDPAALAQDTEDIDHEESADDEGDLS
jgi:hypothetical protein